MSVFLGFNGKKLAWQNRKWKSVEHFNRTQSRWTIAAFIVATLIGVGINVYSLSPVFVQARWNADRSESQSNLKQIGLAMSQYLRENDEKFPPMADIEALKLAITPYLQDPTDPEKVNRLFSPRNRASYDCTKQLSGVSEASLEYMSELPMVFENAIDKEGGRNVLYADGHVKWLNLQGWEQAQKAIPSTFTPVPDESVEEPVSPIVQTSIPLKIVKASFKIQPFRGQSIDAALFINDRFIYGDEIPRKSWKNYRLMKWTLTVSNPAPLNINKFSYKPRYLTKKGFVVKNSIGLPDDVKIMQTTDIVTYISPRDTGVITLYDLVTRRASEGIAKASIRIVATELEHVSFGSEIPSPAEGSDPSAVPAPTRDDPFTPFVPSPSDNGAGGNPDSGSSNSFTDALSTYKSNLLAAPGMEAFVSDVGYFNNDPDAVVVYVTSAFVELDRSGREHFMQTFITQWEIANGKTGRTSVVAKYGSDIVGRQTILGGVEVDE